MIANIILTTGPLSSDPLPDEFQDNAGLNQSGTTDNTVRGLFLIAVIVVAYLLYKLYFQKYLKQGKSGQIKIALVAIGLVFVALAVTGKAPALFAVLGAAMTQFMRFAPLLVRFAPSLKRHFGGAASAAGGFGRAASGGERQSRVKTASLLMTLDHETGNIDGEVTASEWTGKQLSELEISALKGFYLYCEARDPDALRLLQAYIARARAEEWRQETGTEFHEDNAGDQKDDGSGNSNRPAGGDAIPTLAEAYDILALKPGASRKQVTQAHRSLMAKLHPDKGGSTYLAARVNAARQIILDDIERRA